jgi:hypothetical protein
MVLDGRVFMPVGDDPRRAVFTEFKTPHWCTSTYSDADIRHAARFRSMQRRAEGVHGEFVKSAIDLDIGTTADTRHSFAEHRLIALGPVQPMVLGHYGELRMFFEALLLSTAAGAHTASLSPCSAGCGAWLRSG